MSSKLRWHLGHLDSLRGIAVLGVVMVHSAIWDGSYLPLPLRVLDIARTGQRGVALFFIVSAFTLFLSFENRKEEKRPTLNFFIRRYFRLAPMFYLAIAITWFFLHEYAGRRRDVLLAFTFLNGLSASAIGHGAAGGWSVADEALFYLCLPFLFSRIRSLRSAALWAGAGWIVAFKVMWYISNRHPAQSEFLTFLSFPVELPVFLLGILGYFVWKELLRGDISVEKAKQISLLILGLGGVLYGVLVPFTNRTLYPSSVVCLLLLVGVSLHSWPLLVNRYTQFLGRISYSIYLLHFAVYLSLQRWWPREGLLGRPMVEMASCFFITLAVTIPMAAVTWRWVEEPGIRAGRRLIAHLEGSSFKDHGLVPPMRAVAGAGNSPDAQF